MDKNIKSLSFISKIGPLTIFEEDNKIIEIKFLKSNASDKTETLLLCKKEIEEYLEGKVKNFSVEFLIRGTEFQKEVYKELLKIPYGERKSYKEIADLVKRDKAYRAVGLACNKNKIPLIIPCHRVIGSDKKLVGYAGGIETKKFLLELEEKKKDVV